MEVNVGNKKTPLDLLTLYIPIPESLRSNLSLYTKTAEQLVIFTIADWKHLPKTGNNLNK